MSQLKDRYRTTCSACGASIDLVYGFHVMQVAPTPDPDAISCYSVQLCRKCEIGAYHAAARFVAYSCRSRGVPPPWDVAAVQPAAGSEEHMSHDEQPDDPHGECRAEIETYKRLNAYCSKEHDCCAHDDIPPCGTCDNCERVEMEAEITRLRAAASALKIEAHERWKRQAEAHRILCTVLGYTPGEQSIAALAAEAADRLKVKP